MIDYFLGSCFIECCMYDSATDLAYSSNNVRKVAPALYQLLEDHLGQCRIQDFGRPFEVNNDVVSCPVCKVRIANLRHMAPGLVFEDDIRPKDVGIIGFGNFGSFIARHLAFWFDVVAYDIQDRSANAFGLGVEWAALQEVARKDIVMLAVPLKAMEEVLKNIASHVRPGALVMDVCSVKQEPMRLLQKYLPGIDIVGTHPLFGPQSAKDGVAGHKIVVCRPADLQNTTRLDFLRNVFACEWHLKVVDMDPEEHDRQMAIVQGLTHFIARAVKEVGVESSELSTKAFEHLCEAVKLLGGDSWELFKTIERGNLFAGEVRRRFVEKLVELERRIAE